MKIVFYLGNLFQPKRTLQTSATRGTKHQNSFKFIIILQIFIFSTWIGPPIDWQSFSWSLLTIVSRCWTLNCMLMLIYQTISAIGSIVSTAHKNEQNTFLLLFLLWLYCVCFGIVTYFSRKEFWDQRSLMFIFVKWSLRWRNTSTVVHNQWDKILKWIWIKMIIS